MDGKFWPVKGGEGGEILSEYRMREGDLFRRLGGRGRESVQVEKRVDAMVEERCIDFVDFLILLLQQA